jgi:diguanylate cyclase (GGDEF)-like protein
METESRFNETEINSELEKEVQRLRQENEELERKAYYDENTGLLNRHGLKKELEDRGLVPDVEYSPEQRSKSPKVSILMLDIDRFKSYNDVFGHSVGDEILKAVAEQLRKIFRDTDIVARWGGEELVVVCRGTDAQGILNKLHTRTEDDIKEQSPGRARFNVPILVEGEEFKVTASGGVTDFDPRTESFVDALKRADRGSYEAKGTEGKLSKEGRDRILRAS